MTKQHTSRSAPSIAVLTALRRPRARRWAGCGVALCLALGALLLAGCQNLSSIDRKIDRAVRERSETLGGGAIATTPRADKPDIRDRRSLYNTDPRSENPGADEILFDIAEDVDVQARLARLESYSVIAEDGREITLTDAWRIAQQSSREFLDAEEEYILAAIRLLIERHLWGPRFFNDTSLGYNLSPVDPSGGDYRATLNVINSLRATQRLPFGGEVSAEGIVRATRQLSNAATEDYVQSSEIVLGANLPLLRGAGMIAREDLIQSERDLVYAARRFENFRREFLVSIARDYFNLVLQLNSIRNQETSLESVRLQEARTAAQVEAGRRNPFERRQFEQSVLQSENDLISERERFILAMDRFKIRLGLPVETQIRVAPVALELPEPRTSPDQAAALALRYRLDLQNRRDQYDDVRRAVLNAENQLLPELNIGGAVSFNTPRDQDEGHASFNISHTDYRANLVLSLPLDRERERLGLRSALIARQRTERNLNRFEDEIVLEARQAVRDIDRAKFSIELQELSVQSGELRLEELTIKEDEIDARDRLDAENDLLRARNNRDAAIRDLRVAILDYLLATGLMRVAPDGGFQPLAGMQPGRALQEPDGGFPARTADAPEFRFEPPEVPE